MKSAVPLQLAAGLVWAAIGTTALLVPMLAHTGQTSAPAAIAEILLCAPMALWLGQLTALALVERRVVLRRRSLWQIKQPAWFWSMVAALVVIAGVFLAGFVRGLVSITAYL